MFGATFNLVRRVGSHTTVIYGILTDGSLEINSFALNNRFNYRNVVQNNVNAMSKTIFEKPGFLSKSSKFSVVWTIRFCSNFTSMLNKHFKRNVWRDFILPMSALATVAGKSFNGKFTAKTDRVFYVTIADADIGSLKPLHTLFDKYLDHMLVKFEQNIKCGTLIIYVQICVWLNHMQHLLCSKITVEIFVGL